MALNINFDYLGEYIQMTHVGSFQESSFYSLP